MKKTYLDSETCGLHSMPVLLQYALDDGPIHLYDIWKEPVGKTLKVIQEFCETTVVGFNLTFDWYHIAKLYTIWNLLPPHWIPEEHIEAIAELEPCGQDGPCVKPAGALDLLLHSRKGPYQSLMARSDIRIRRVPEALAYSLRNELEQRIEIDDLYFARSKDKDAPRWKVYDIHKGDQLIEGFKDVVLKFNPAGGLKFLAEHALGLKPKFHYSDVEPPREWFPYEFGYAPTAKACSSRQEGWKVKVGENKDGSVYKRAWPAVIDKFIDHWASHENAREYARDDIVYTRELDKFFGCPEPNDDDSILACMVGAIRWHGYRIDMDGIREMRAKAQAVVDASPVNPNKPSEIRAYLMGVMDDMEATVIEETTEKARLKSIKKWCVDEREPCTKCNEEGCTRCNGAGKMIPVESDNPKMGTHPAAHRAAEVLAVKEANKEIELYNKLLRAGKFHASFVIVGTLSSRMSGTDGLNAQGIKGEDEVRCLFPLAWPGMILCGGDFDSFEVTLADAVYDDPHLRKALLSGKKIHAMFAMQLYPGMSYEDVLANKKAYADGKAGVFAMTYGGDWGTLMRNLGIDEEHAKAAYDGWGKSYSGIGKAREETFDKFCSMRQPNGIGTQVVWNDPADYVESFLGFRRYFTLENKICKALFDLANDPPKEWKRLKLRCQRARDGRVQTVNGAVSSALYGAAFQIQAANMRAAANHEIQSPGGQITKRVQRRIWDLQPSGVNEWRVAPMNVHDEIMCVTHPDATESVRETVRETVESYRDRVPLIGMTWLENMPDWSGKKTAGDPIKIRCPEMMEFD